MTPTTSEILLQFVTIQRAERPIGRRILADGTLQRTAPTNPPPGEDDLLEKDRVLEWETVRQLDAAALATIRQTLHDSGFFDLPPRLLINYCKEDPGTQIWQVRLDDGRAARVVLYDPKPKRDPVIDRLNAAILPLVADS